MAGDGWISMRLGDVCTKIGSGATPRGGSGVYLESGTFALIRSQNIHNDGFHHEGLVYITEEHADQLSSVEVEPGDVLLNITGDSVARCCQVDPSVLPARVNQHVAIIRPDPERLDARFLRYFMVSPHMQEMMLSWAGSGGTRNALTKGMIESFQIVAPSSVIEQRAIACILGTLDDKIELNRRMNQTLEEMAQAIFRSWFVDFDPVRAKAAGQQPAGLAPQIVALFTDSFEESEIGEVPAGWKKSPLNSIALLRKEMVKPWESAEKRWEHFSIPAFDSGKTAIIEKGISIKSGKYRVPPTSVLVSKLNPQYPRVWLPDVTTEDAAICSTEFMPFVPFNPDRRPFLYELLKSERVQQGIKERVTGSTGSRQRATPEDVTRIDVIMPPSKLIDTFCRMVISIHTKAQYCIREAGMLGALRDALLPKLILGELAIADAERIIGRAS